MTIQAPAKVNLSLRVHAKRTDGYHEIETLMAPIDLADEMEIEISEGNGIDLQCEDKTLPIGRENLVWQAVETFFQHTGDRFFARIRLRKKIPSGAGLGGGSSDAAAILKALDRMRETRLGQMQMEMLAARLGSDVPFFIRAQPALCCGRGERMQAVGEFPAAKLLLLKPPFPVSTAWAYQAWNTCVTTSRQRQFLGSIELTNDLEGPVFRKYLLLPAIKAWLLEQEDVEAAMMSGSGSTFFAILRQNAEGLTQRAKERFGQSLWVAETKIKI